MRVRQLLFLLLMLPAAFTTGATNNNYIMTDDSTISNTQPLHTVPFAWSKDIVSKTEMRKLRRLAESLDSNRPLILSGYTDSIGPDEYNHHLAQRRIDAVSLALVSFGVPVGQIDGHARGKQNYRSSNKTKAGRARNRRVEIEYKDQWLRVVNGGSSVGSQSTAADPQRVGRYSTLAPVPTKDQTNPLGSLVRTKLPTQVQTVGAALAHLLSRSGWRLADPENSDPAMDGLMRLPLPEIQRDMGPVRLIDVVQVLCGDPFVVVVDPVHRLISCELREPYSHWSSLGSPLDSDNPPESSTKPEDGPS